VSRRRERAKRAGAERGAGAGTERGAGAGTERGAGAGTERGAGAGTERGAGGATAARRSARDRVSAPERPASRLGPQVALLIAVFGLAVLIAELAGATNLGVAFGVGQIAFALAAVYVLVKR
jgi:hypothetical protein